MRRMYVAAYCTSSDAVSNNASQIRCFRAHTPKLLTTYASGVERVYSSLEGVLLIGLGGHKSSLLADLIDSEEQIIQADAF